MLDRSKKNARNRKWTANNLEKSRASSRKCYQNNDGYKASAARRARLSSYGQGALDHYNQRFEEQQGCCAICGRVFFDTPPCQDHNTSCCSYEKVGNRRRLKACGSCNRGLLCKVCNTKLAILEDETFAVKARDYLEKWRK